MFFSIFYIFAININKNKSFTYKRYENNNIITKLKNIDSINLLHDQINSFFSSRFVVVNSSIFCESIFFVLKSAINQNASINKNSKNSNSKNLKQHTFAKSISFCCFCFCLILKYRSFYYINLQIFSLSKFSTKCSTKFSFSWFYIFFVFVFAFFVFVFIFSRLLHLFWIFLFLL